MLTVVIVVTIVILVIMMIVIIILIMGYEGAWNVVLLAIVFLLYQQ